MYKKVDISAVIGAVLYIDETFDKVSIEMTRQLLAEIREFDEFIETDYSPAALENARELADYDVTEKEIRISDEKVRNRFLRAYYGLDIQTRETMFRVVRDYVF